ncbi:LPP20 family lipoprotein [Pelagibaculum spongiae]|nr:LPP20 family lipoprotein [Pelagibaculum spongiae]
MDDVFDLLDSGGGLRVGVSDSDGYYMLALSLNDSRSETRASELARLDCIRQLNEMVNGVTISGSSSMLSEYITEESSDSSTGEKYKKSFSKSSFIDVVETKFSGKISAAQVLKQGEYDGQQFIAMLITEKNIQLLNKMKASTADFSEDSGEAPTFSNETKPVEAKGLSSLKIGESKAREQALQNALRNAVQQVQGVILEGKSGTFGEALNTALSTKTRGYVSSYQIEDEDIERGSYYVLISASVSAGKLERDLQFYLNIFSDPVFTITSNDLAESAWVADELERLGFNISQGTKSATHTFIVNKTQTEVIDHLDRIAIETKLYVQLKDLETGEVLSTITNAPRKTRFSVEPISRAKKVSSRAAYKQINKKLGAELIQVLSQRAESGQLFDIEIVNARRTDWKIFKHVLENATTGSVESWLWDKGTRTITLKYRYGGKLSTALDEGLSQLYTTFKTQGKGRRPTALNIGGSKATFEMVTK